MAQTIVLPYPTRTKSTNWCHFLTKEEDRIRTSVERKKRFLTLSETPFSRVRGQQDVLGFAAQIHRAGFASKVQIGVGWGGEVVVGQSPVGTQHGEGVVQGRKSVAESLIQFRAVKFEGNASARYGAEDEGEANVHALPVRAPRRLDQGGGWGEPVLGSLPVAGRSLVVGADEEEGESSAGVGGDGSFQRRQIGAGGWGVGGG